MASVNDLNGLYKQVYATSIEDAVPDATHILRKVKFSEKSLQLGLYYNQPVVLTQEQGWTYLAPSYTTGSLSGSMNMALQNAQVIGGVIAGQSTLTVEAAKRAVSGGAAAFRDAIGLQMEVMMDSGKKRQEVNFLHGQTALALVNSNTHINATATVLSILSAEWAGGFWAGMQNARFDAYQADGATKLNSTGPLVVLTSNAAQTSVTFTANSADITAVENYANSSSASSNTANACQLFFYGAVGNEAPGIKAQLVNTGTLFNINAAAYDLWNGTQYSVPSPGQFSFTQLQKALAKAVARGLDEEVDVYVNPDTWANLLNDQAALRFYTDASGTFKNGAEELSFYGQNGKVNIIPHIYVKSGQAFILPMKKVKRIGVSEMTFNIPGTDKGRIFIQNSTAFSFEYRCYAQETIFIEMPARCVYVSGIVN